MNTKIQEIVQGISELSLLETAELKDRLIEELGIDYSLPTIINTNIQTETKVEEQTEFTVILTGHPSDRKIETIKRIRQITGLGLVESKKAVESVPFIIKEGISKDEAEKIKSIFLDLGNIIEIK